MPTEPRQPCCPVAAATVVAVTVVTTLSTGMFLVGISIIVLSKGKSAVMPADIIK